VRRRIAAAGVALFAAAFAVGWATAPHGRPDPSARQPILDLRGAPPLPELRPVARRHAIVVG
jgi:hypothetical protein